jgi:phosphotransferase system IIB component
MFDYFTAKENEQYLFLQLPLMLIKDDTFKGLSDGAKILYSLLLNRTSLSIKNGWEDEKGRVYIIYTIEEIMGDLNCWEQKAVKSMKELCKIGLIKSIRQGQGKANLIYVMNFATGLKYKTKETSKLTNPEISMNCENHNSSIAEITTLELRKSQCINNDFRENDFRKIENTHGDKSQSQSQSRIEEKTDTTRTFDNDLTANIRVMSENINRLTACIEQVGTELKQASSENTVKCKEVLPIIHANQSIRLGNTSEQSLYQYNTLESLIQEQVDYQNLLTSVKRGDKALIDNLVGIIVDVISTENSTVKIGEEIKPHAVVKSVYMKLNSDHIEHVVNKYKEQHHKITYKKAYLRTALYNAFLELDAHYTNAVRADGLVW